MNAWKRIARALLALLTVTIIGTVGYIVLGFGPLNALYQTVTTVTTVGFREIEPIGTSGKIFTIVLIIGGVGTALYTLSAVLEVLVEGQLREVFGRKRMERDIERLSGHTIVCGWGRVGRTFGHYTEGLGHDVVIIDEDEARLADCPHPNIVGDATADEVLEQAGIARARAVVAAVADDAANLFIVISAKALRPDVFVVARVRSERNEAKLLSAGADRVVNPQQIGGARMAAFVLQPHVAEFLDVVMHDGSLEFRLGELEVTESSGMAGQTLRETRLRERTGAMVLAMRTPGGEFLTNPPATTPLRPGHVLIAVGTEDQLGDLRRAVQS